MKRTWITGVISCLAVVLTGWTGGPSRIQSQQAPPAAKSKEPSTQEASDAFVQRISKQIAGHEEEPSERYSRICRSIFSSLLLIMNLGYSKTLGVTGRWNLVD